MQHNFETLGHLRNFINSLSENELKQPVKVWGESFGGTINGAEILDEDYFNPSGEGCERVSAYKDEPDFEEDYADEPIIYEKGTVIFEVDRNNLPLIEHTFEHVFNDFAEFSKRTYLRSTAAGALIHLQREADEVKAELEAGEVNREALVEEYADMLLCIISSATRTGFHAENLVFAMHKKTQKNKARKWKYNGDGTYSHIKETAQ
jgi:hypothetical protein